MQKEAGPLFESSLIIRDPEKARVALLTHYGIQSCRQVYQLQEFGVHTQDIEQIFNRIDDNVEEMIIEDKRDSDGHLIFAQGNLESAYIEGQKEALVNSVEEKYQRVTSHLLNEYTMYTRNAKIFENCETQDLQDAVIATGGVPLAQPTKA